MVVPEQENNVHGQVSIAETNIITQPESAISHQLESFFYYFSDALDVDIIDLLNRSRLSNF